MKAKDVLLNKTTLSFWHERARRGKVTSSLTWLLNHNTQLRKESTLIGKKSKLLKFYNLETLAYGSSEDKVLRKKERGLIFTCNNSNVG